MSRFILWSCFSSHYQALPYVANSQISINLAVLFFKHLCIFNRHLDNSTLYVAKLLQTIYKPDFIILFTTGFYSYFSYWSQSATQASKLEVIFASFSTLPKTNDCQITSPPPPNFLTIPLVSALAHALFSWFLTFQEFPNLSLHLSLFLTQSTLYNAE